MKEEPASSGNSQRQATVELEQEPMLARFLIGKRGIEEGIGNVLGYRYRRILDGGSLLHDQAELS